jgi:hypothetical protein
MHVRRFGPVSAAAVALLVSSGCGATSSHGGPTPVAVPTFAATPAPTTYVENGTTYTRGILPKDFPAAVPLVDRTVRAASVGPDPVTGRKHWSVLFTVDDSTSGCLAGAVGLLRQHGYAQRRDVATGGRLAVTYRGHGYDVDVTASPATGGTCQLLYGVARAAG